MSAKSRDLNLDLIRSIAVCSVLSLHFFLNTEFYKTPVAGTRMFIMTIMRSFFMVAVPFFLLLTGYLVNKKTLSFKYYKGILYPVGIYLLTSIINILYEVLILNDSMSFKTAILSLLNFKAVRYAWYIEMYMGLFLLIPFLNLIYNGLKSHKQKLVLIFTFFTLTTLPSLITFNNNEILPDWWKGIYPLTYYFIGAYIREYDVKIKKSLNFVLLMAVVLLSGIYNFNTSYNNIFTWGKYNDWGGIQVMLTSVLSFLLLKHLNLLKLPQFLKKLITIISKLSLGIYLASGIFDTIFYKRLNSMVQPMPKRLNYFIVIVPLVLIASSLFAVVTKYLYEWLDILIGKAMVKIKNKVDNR